MTVLSKRMMPNLTLFNFNTRNTDYEWLGYGRVRNKQTGQIIDTNVLRKKGQLKDPDRQPIEEEKRPIMKNYMNGAFKWMFAY
tara:strand:+ start:793 stop:1041 length:249 start_codon:yes stop_codon:yes gene_type:complete